MVRARAMVSGTELYERLMLRLCTLQGARRGRVRYPEGEVQVLDLPGSGDLPPIVLLHGFSASGPTQYMSMVQHLRRRTRRIVMPDLPGHGSSTIPKRFDAAVVQRGLDAALDAVLDEPAVIFATSLAGGFAVRYALRRPAVVAGLMLCSPSGAPLSEDEHRELRATFAIDSHHGALSFVDRLFVEPHPLRQAYAWGVRQQFNRPHLRAFIERVQVERDQPGDEPDSRFLAPHELSALPMPVALLWGDGDRILPRAHLAYFKRHLPADAEIDTPATFGHAPFLNQSRQVTDRLLAFAGRVATRRDPSE